MTEPASDRRLIATACAAALALVLLVLMLRGDGASIELDDAPHAKRTTDATESDVELAAERARALDDDGIEVESARRVLPASERNDLPIEGRHDVAMVAVRVVIEPNPWISGDASGHVVWCPAGNSSQVHRFGIVDGRVRFRGRPTAEDEYVTVRLEGLVARVVAVEEPQPGDDCEVVLRVLPETGARLVYAPSVPLGARVPVDVQLTDPRLPAQPELFGDPLPWTATERLESVQLPATLPRWAMDRSIGVGAPECVFQSVRVARGAEEVEIELMLGARICAYHDVDPDGGYQLVVEPIDESVAGTTRSRRDRSRFQSCPIDASDPVTTEVLLPGRYAAYLEDTSDVMASHRVEVELEPGRTEEIDLTSAAMLAACGAIRIVLHTGRVGDEQELSTCGITIARLDANSPDPKWSESRRIEPPDVLDRHQEYGSISIDMLEPGSYRVVATPIGAVASVEVAAGELSIVDLWLDRTGSVRFVAGPTLEEDPGELSIHLTSLEPSGSDGPSWSLDATFAPPGNELALAAGRYRAVVWTRELSIFLTCDLFEVAAGATVNVEVSRRELININFIAKDRRTGLSVHLDARQWTRSFSVADATTGTPLVRLMAFLNESSAKPLTAAVARTNELVRITTTDLAKWTVEPIEPLVLADGDTITLWLNAKEE